jgi:hypothetical protein
MGENAFLTELPIDFPEIDFSEMLKEYGDISLSEIFEDITGETLCKKKTEKKRKPQARKPSRKKS